MSLKSQNEFEDLMRKQIYSDNQIMKKVADYFDEKDSSERDKFYDSLYEEFEKAYDEKDSKEKEAKKDLTNSDLAEEEIEQIDEDELDEKVISEDDGKEYTRRELLYKELYLKNLKKYYSLRNRIHKQDVKENGDISFNNYNFRDVLRYEIYLSKLDKKFKAISGSYISKEFDDVNGELNSYIREEDRYEDSLNRKYEKSYARINELNNILDEISEKIELLNPNDEDYEEKYNSLMDSYLENVAKLHMMEPNILELEMQEDKKQEQDKIISKNVGTEYQRKSKQSYDKANFRKSLEEKARDKKRGIYYYNDKTKVEGEIEDSLEAHITIIKANIESIKTKIRNADYEGLEDLVRDTKDIIEIYKIDRSSLEKEIDSEDIDMLDNIDIDKLKEVKKQDKENNKDAVEKDEGFATELGFVADDSEIMNYSDIKNDGIERERER